MITTRAGQIVCRGNWNDFGGEEEVPVKWFVDTNNGYRGQVRFDEELLRKYNYYKSYVDDLGRNYYDIRFFLEGFDDSSASFYTNLSKVNSQAEEERGEKNYYIKNDEIYCAKFKVLYNEKYHQNFSFVLYNSETGNKLTIQSFKIPARSSSQVLEIYFCPESFGVSDRYDQIILEVDRSDASSMNVIMELDYFYLYKLNNLIKNITDENGDVIEEFLGLEFETVNRGECIFFVNFDVFYVGNDKVLNIDEDLEVSIRKLAYIKYIPSDTTVDYVPEDYITCLINYKY